MALVLTAPDRPAGRGRPLSRCPVKLAALDLDLPVEQPESLRDPAQWQQISAVEPDHLIVADYGIILPAGLLDLPARGAINIHASLLPRWRGAAPVARALLAGDATSGISIIQMDAGVDTGMLLLTRAVPILPGERAGALEDRLAAVGAAAILEVLAGLTEGTVRARAQPASGASYAHKLRKHDASLDWRRPALALERQIRALHPRPGAHAQLDGQRLRVWAASVVSDVATLPAGRIRLHQGRELWVATGDGWLRLDVVQIEGGRAMPTADFMRGHAIGPGASFNLPDHVETAP